MKYIMSKEVEYKKALDEAYKKAGHNAYFANGFNAGYEYADQQSQNDKDRVKELELQLSGKTNGGVEESLNAKIKELEAQLLDVVNKSCDKVDEQSRKIVDLEEKLAQSEKDRIESSTKAVNIICELESQNNDLKEDIIFKKKQVDKMVTMLSSIHDIVDKQNFNEDSDLHEIYKITHNSF